MGNRTRRNFLKTLPCLPHLPYLFAASSLSVQGLLEIENPFCQDLNDLSLDEVCSTLLQNIEDLIYSNLSDRTILDAPEAVPIQAEQVNT